MSDSLRDKLIFHGALVIILGLLAGIPFAMVLLGQMTGEVRAWRMAHLEGVLNGLLCIAAAGVLGSLKLDAKKLGWLAWSLIVMSYCNVFASIIGAFTGNRGLEATGPAANLIVFSLFMVAIVGVFVGVGLLAAGARSKGGAGGGSVAVDVQVSESPSSAPRVPSRPISTAADVEVSVSGADVEVSVDGDGDDEDAASQSRATRRRKKRKR